MCHWCYFPPTPLGLCCPKMRLVRSGVISFHDGNACSLPSCTLSSPCVSSHTLLHCITPASFYHGLNLQVGKKYSKTRPFVAMRNYSSNRFSFFNVSLYLQYFQDTWVQYIKLTSTTLDKSFAKFLKASIM